MVHIVQQTASLHFKKEKGVDFMYKIRKKFKTK